MTKISVIIPCYNVEDKIEKCLDSLANQTYKDIEFIIINDGSTDKTLDIINKYMKTHKDKFKLITRENRGISASRNEGIDLATGEYIGFVDSDDYIEYDMYEKLYNKIKDTSADIVFCDYLEISEKSKKVIKKGKVNFEGNLLNNPELFTEIWYAPWNKLYKKELFDEIRFPINTKYEDLDTILKVFSKAKKIVKLDETLYNYVLNNNGQTFTIDEKVFDIFKVFNDLIEYFKDYKTNKKIDKEFEKLVCDSLFSYLQTLVASNKFNYDFIYKFYINILNILNNNFKNWKLNYIFRSKNLNNYKTRLLQTNKLLYYKYLKKKRKLKKEVLITAYTMTTGGVSKALINLLNNIDTKKYHITLYLQLKQGELLNFIDNENIEIKGYNLTKCKAKVLKKIINLFKYLKILIINFNKYDFSACFESGYPLSSVLALIGSKNNACWMHTNIVKYMEFSDWFKKYKDVNKKVKMFVNKRMHFRSFKRLLFVSKDGKNAYLKVYPQDKNKCYICHNFIDYNSIITKKEEKIDIKKSNIYTFLNVSRHTEFDKRISLIIDACNLLNKENINFKVILVGDGKDHQNYMEQVKKYKLENRIIFTGLKNNPYPYYKIADCFILTSNFEGYPVVFNESLVTNIPIITTDVSDAKEDINKKYGSVIKDNSQSLYKTMKKYIINKEKIKQPFDYVKFNNNSMNLIERMINNEI